LKGGVRYVDPINKSLPGYLSVSGTGIPKPCNPKTNKSCYTNERDLDVASVVILPLKMTSRANPQDEINYQVASSNYVCTQKGTDNKPDGCNVSSKDTYPKYNPTPSKSAITWKAKPMSNWNKTSDTSFTVNYSQAPVWPTNAPTGDKPKAPFCGLLTKDASGKAIVVKSSHCVIDQTTKMVRVSIDAGHGTINPSTQWLRMFAEAIDSKGLYDKNVTVAQKDITIPATLKPAVIWKAKPMSNWKKISTTSFTVNYSQDPVWPNNAPTGDKPKAPFCVLLTKDASGKAIVVKSSHCVIDRTTKTVRVSIDAGHGTINPSTQWLRMFAEAIDSKGLYDKNVTVAQKDITIPATLKPAVIWKAKPMSNWKKISTTSFTVNYSQDPVWPNNAPTGDKPKAPFCVLLTKDASGKAIVVKSSHCVIDRTTKTVRVSIDAGHGTINPSTQWLRMFAEAIDSKGVYDPRVTAAQKDIPILPPLNSTDASTYPTL